MCRVTTTGQILTNAYDTDEAWRVIMNTASVATYVKTGDFYVWPVRSDQDGSFGNSNIWKTGQTTCYDELGNMIDCAGTGQDGEIQAGVDWPDPRFTDNGDNTVTDNLTGLVWLKDPTCLGGSKTWQSALNAVSNFNSNSGDYDCTSDTASSFVYVPSGGGYWSSTTYTSGSLTDRTWAWEVWLEGRTSAAVPKEWGWHILPVRAGQVGSDTYNDWRLPNRKELYSLKLFGLTDYSTSYNSTDISVSSTSHDFGSINIGSSSTTRIFTISNTGDADLVIETISLTGTDIAEFDIQNDSCSGQLIIPSGDCTIDAIFSPTSDAAKSANLSISSNDLDTPNLDVNLFGEGVVNNDNDDNGNDNDDNGNDNDGDVNNVTICHKPGTPAEKTLTIPEYALEAHLDHGDNIGSCEEDGNDDDGDDDKGNGKGGGGGNGGSGGGGGGNGGGGGGGNGGGGGIGGGSGNVDDGDDDDNGNDNDDGGLSAHDNLSSSIEECTTSIFGSSSNVSLSWTGVSGSSDELIIEVGPGQ